MKYLIAVLILLGFAADASACNRCGFRQCRYVSKVVTPYVAPIKQYVATPQNVYVVQNAYPAPLVAQGATQYASSGSYQNLVLPLLDPNAYFHQELQLLKAAADTNALRAERSSQLFERVAQLQAPVAEKLATGQAAKMVLDAAGLNSATQQTGSSQAVVIRRDEYGKVSIERLNATEAQPPPAEAGGKYPLTSQFCAKCHGTTLAQPKGDFYIGDDANVAKTLQERFFGITQHLRNKTMPPATEPQPSDDERRGIVDEIEAMILSHSQPARKEP